MSEPSCPSCGAKATQWLGSVSREGWVNFYRCTGCGCAWTVRQGPDTTPEIIADGPRTPAQRTIR